MFDHRRVDATDLAETLAFGTSEGLDLTVSGRFMAVTPRDNIRTSSLRVQHNMPVPAPLVINRIAWGGAR